MEVDEERHVLVAVKIKVLMIYYINVYHYVSDYIGRYVFVIQSPLCHLSPLFVFRPYLI